MKRKEYYEKIIEQDIKNIILYCRQVKNCKKCKYNGNTICKIHNPSAWDIDY